MIGCPLENHPGHKNRDTPDRSKKIYATATLLRFVFESTTIKLLTLVRSCLQSARPSFVGSFGTVTVAPSGTSSTRSYFFEYPAIGARYVLAIGTRFVLFFALKLSRYG